MSIDELKSILKPDSWTDNPDAIAPHLSEWRGLWAGKTPLMLVPSSVEEVARAVAHCAAAKIGIVPQGGNTGLCGAAIPDNSGSQVLLSLSRLNRIRSVDPDNFSMCVEAGCVLADLQSAAEDAGRYFPLSLAAEGSCQIGGNISTNAGGVNVLRYGTAREQVLGLEVVLADGTVWNGLRALRKDTAGYDMKQLFIGAEGTLGIITAAVLRLYPPPRDMRSLWAAVASPRHAVQFLSFMRDTLGDNLHAFELLSDRSVRFVRRHVGGTRLPGSDDSAWYVLADVVSWDQGDAMERALSAAVERGIVNDVVLAKNQQEADSFWRLRHSVSTAQKAEGESLKHDISVPLDKIPDFIDRAGDAVRKLIPGARIVAFGHVGDGNVHYNVSQPAHVDGGQFAARRPEVATLIYDIVVSLGGSISAEHGIGVLKRQDLKRYRSAAELGLMRSIREALDPDHILNPGKVL
ncbi:MAG: FAD-binding oxidoreductase [Gammaproteobacteria bacterium]|nr:FAD-binding oxidoreductase [Gammaproteobacteria bacterium]